MAERDTSPTSISSTLSNITVQTEKQPGSRTSSSASPPTSTPPTSLGDEASILSDNTAKIEQLAEAQEEASTSTEAQAVPQPATDAPSSEGRRSARNSSKSVTTYNVQILAGTAIHTPTKYLEKHHKNVLHGSLEDVVKSNTPTPPKKRAPRLKTETSDVSDPAEEQLATEAAQAAQRRTSSRVTDLRREAFRNLSGVGEAVANTLSGGKELVQNALRRSASDSRLRSTMKSAPSASPKRPRTARGTRSDEHSTEPGEEKVFLKPKTKIWLKHGLYVGQHREFNARLSETQNRVRRKSKKSAESTILPLPMFSGERMLSGDPKQNYRDFKLPFDTYHPLPRKVKVDGWVKLHKNRFIGDASALWKRDKQDSSQCYCDPEDGCGEACHNRIMAYECDSTNCRLTPEQCGNRPFAQLKRRAKGNGYDYGVEVTETEDRGYGVRAMRTFEPHQIIVEYAGEIITQTECERRMKQVYKKDKCYYLMSFDNKMIIDATRGTIARFVNHSCEPNCEMIKWTVGGEPRMALFAGRRGIMTGEELTYDYNFDPFSQKNIQECRCGTESCRGVLGPKPKKPIQEAASMASAFLTGTKRKFQDLLGTGRRGSESAPNSPKKRKVSMGGPATTKARNAFAESEAARERAERSAAEHSRQIASREDRALKRGGSMTMTRRSRSALLRKPTRATMPALKSTRRTAVTIKRKVSRPGALKPVKKSSASRLGSALRRNTTSTLKGKKGIRPSTKTPKTPMREETPEESSEDESPNITPASLRSASRKSKSLTQTKLPFKPLNFPSVKSKAKAKFEESDDDTDMEVPDSEDEDYKIGKTYASSRGRGRKRGSASAPRGMHKTGAGVQKPTGSFRGRKRSARGRFLARSK